MLRQEACRDAVCAFEAHLEAWPPSVTRPARCTGRVHPCSYRTKPTPARQTGRSATTVSRLVRGIAVVGVDAGRQNRRSNGAAQRSTTSKQSIQYPAALRADFCNKIGSERTCQHVRSPVAIGSKADSARIGRSASPFPPGCSPPPTRLSNKEQVMSRFGTSLHSPRRIVLVAFGA